MADFNDLVSDDRAARRLACAINGRGAFRRFKDELNEEYPHLLLAWYAFRDARAAGRPRDGQLSGSSGDPLPVPVLGSCRSVLAGTCYG